MKRLVALCVSAVMLVTFGAGSGAVLIKKPLVAPPAALRQMPAKAMCTDEQGGTTAAGDSAWTSRTSDGVLHDCTPYACDAQKGLCRTRAANTDQCRPGFNWWAKDNTCSQCGPDNYMDTATHTCKQGNPNPQ